MALRRYTRQADGTIPVPALLYDDEELISSQDNVGIYDGQQKAPDHQNGTIYLSTHRLFYIDSQKQFSNSFAMDLSFVTQTEYYAGLFKSSAKVTLHLSIENSFLGPPSSNEPEDVFESWRCEVCNYRNPPGLSPAAARICALCGVPRSSASGSSASTPSVHQRHISSSLPSSAIPSALSSSTSLVAQPTTRPPQSRKVTSIACPACTFLNHPSLLTCEICATPLPRESQPDLSMKSAPSSRPASPDIDEDGNHTSMIKLSFRKGGDKAFYAVLKRTLQAKAWEANGIGKKSKAAGSSSNDLGVTQNSTNRSGIDGILRTVEKSAQRTATDMKDALQDLEALMVKAKDMVRLAAELNERLTASSTTTTTSTPLSSPPVSGSSTSTLVSSTPSMTTLVPSTEPEEATFIRSSLSQLGLQMSNTPVTLDMIRDERMWMEELARELARILQGSTDSGKGAVGILRTRGIVALDEVWGSWNRARGVALIPPSTFLSVLPHLPAHTIPPIRARTFASGLSVLHTPPYTHVAFAARLAGLLVLGGPKTTMEIAHEEGITVGLAGEMIGAVENDGDVCRDDGSAAIKGGGSGTGFELRWWMNVFKDYIWDGQDCISR